MLLEKDKEEMPSTDSNNEIFYAIFGKFFLKYFFYGKLTDYNEGSPTKVSFDQFKIFEKIKAGENLIGFYHTHPNFLPDMSSTDVETMFGWLISEGKPLLCIINGINWLDGGRTTRCHKCFEHLETLMSTESDCVFKFGNYIFGMVL